MCGVSLTVASERRAALLADPRACRTHPATSAHTKPAGEQMHTGRVRRRGRGWRARDGRGSPGLAPRAPTATLGSANKLCAERKVRQRGDCILTPEAHPRGRQHLDDERKGSLVLWLVLCDV